MPDEPRPPDVSAHPRLAENVHSNPGAGPQAADLRDAANTWTSSRRRSTSGARAAGFDDRARPPERARGRGYWFYNGGRPGGRRHRDRRAGDRRARDRLGRVQARRARSTSSGTPSTGSTTAEAGRAQAERVGRPASPSTTAASRTSPSTTRATSTATACCSTRARRRCTPTRTAASRGPIGTVQLANLRRGAAGPPVPDAGPHGAGSTGLGRRGRFARSCRASSRTRARRSASPNGRHVRGRTPGARACDRERPAGGDGTRGSATGAVRHSGGRSHPGRDAGLPARQSLAPGHRGEAACTPNPRTIVASIGAEKPLGFNLDMGFVIVPPDQPECR